MPLDDPGDYDSQSEWMSHCVPIEMEGDREQDQAVAICLNMWRNKAAVKPRLKAEEKPEGAYGSASEAGYADPGFQEDKKPRYPLKEGGAYSEKRIRAAWNYIAHTDNQKPYTREQVATIKRRIVAAWRKKIDPDGPPGLDDDEHLGKNSKAEKQMRPRNDESRAEFMERCQEEGESRSDCAMMWEERSHKRAKQNDDVNVPSPREGEDEDDFIERCEDHLTENDVDEGEAASMCALAWENRSARGMRLKAKRNKQNSEVPSPREGEGHEDFISRCEEQLSDNGYDEGEAASTCALAWENRSGSGRLRHKVHSGLVDGLTFCLSDESPDRMGDIISSSGWDLKSFKKNPIALFQHRADFPVGLWEDLHVEDGALRGKLKLAPEGTSERIDEIRKLVEAGILKAVSVGFRPIESRPRKGGERYLGEYFIKQELVETSLVSVPANPNALAIAKSLDISDATLGLVFGAHAKESEIRRTVVPSGEHAETPRNNGDKAMGLAQRISDSEARLVALKDKLADHLGNVDDSNVSDAQLQLTEDLHQRISQEQKQHDALVESERFLMGAKSQEEMRRDQARNAERSNVPAVRTTNGSGNGSTPAPYVIPSRRSPDVPNKKEDRIDLIVRGGVISLFSHMRKVSMDQARADLAKDNPHYGENTTKAFTDYVARAESAPAMTSVTGWAAELVQETYGDYMDLLYPKAVMPRLAAQGLSLNFGRAGRISIPTRERTPSISGSFVGEGRPIPVRQAAFSAQVLTPKKMAVITTWTREISESSVPAIEGLLRNAIQEDTAITIDSCLLDTDPADAVRPAGLLNGVTLTPPTAITATVNRFEALVTDMKNLTGSLLGSTHGNVRNMVLIMNPMETLSISLTAMPGVSAFPFKDEIGGGRLLGYPLIESGSVPMGTVIAIDAADFVVVGGEAPRFEVSDQATLHMENDIPLPIVEGATTASPVRSLWQTDSIGLRLILPINWVMRRAGMVAGIQSVAW